MINGQKNRYEYIMHAEDDSPERCQLLTVRNIDTGFEYYVAKDSMGTQICNDGKFYPDARDFGSVEKAVQFLQAGENASKAEDFFKRTTANESESLFRVMTSLAAWTPSDEVGIDDIPRIIWDYLE